MTRTRACPPEVRRGRLRKATQFLDAAHLAWDFAAEDDIADAYITLCVHAGIAAADVICCARLGEHSQTENHTEAAAHLGKADRDSVKHLRIGSQVGSQLDGNQRIPSDATGNDHASGGPPLIALKSVGGAVRARP